MLGGGREGASRRRLAYIVARVGDARRALQAALPRSAERIGDVSQMKPSTRGWRTGVEVHDEVSAVHSSMRLMRVSVAIGAMGPGEGGDEPAAVYASPYVMMDSERIRIASDYYLGTRFPTGLVPAEGWEDEMLRDGVPPFVVDACRAYVAQHAL